ncbi:MAG: hypothetical protein ACOC1K_03310 [Nanoarchaeota archaeon]
MANYSTTEYGLNPKKQDAIKGSVMKTFIGRFTYDVSEASDNDTYTLARNLDKNTLIKSIRITSEALTAADDNDIYIAKNGETTQISESTLLTDGQDLETALDNEEVLGANVSGFDYTKSLYELTDYEEGTMDIVLAVKTKGTTADADITVEITYCEDL